MTNKNVSTELTIGTEEAENFFHAVASYKAAGRIKEQDNSNTFVQAYKKYVGASETDIDAVLTEVHSSLFARESFLLSAKSGVEKTTRVFPPKKDANILADVDDLFRNGIAFLRAATTIARHANRFQKEDYRELFDVFCDMMRLQRIAYQKEKNVALKREILVKANEQLSQFNGALATHLMRLGIHNQFNHAVAAMRWIRGYQHKMAYPERYCTIKELGERVPTAIQVFCFSQPSTFAKSLQWNSPEWREGVKEAITDTQSTWLDSFLLENEEKLAIISPVPMMRNTPNPSNAHDSTTVFFNAKGTLLQSISWGDAAITEPYGVHDDNARRELTAANHAQLLSEDRLKSFVTYHFSKWQQFYDVAGCEETVTLPYLHQTLIADGVVGSSEFFKGKTMLSNKAYANQKIREELAGKVIYVRKTDSTDVQFKKPANLAAYQKVEFDILEVNNCVNFYERRSNIRNNDVEHSRKLMNYAEKHLARMSKISSMGLSQLDQEVKTVTDFLSSSDHSVFTPYKSRGKKVKQAMATISQRLRNNALPLAHDLDILMRSAVELKCLVHETWIGSLRRQAATYFLNLKLPLIGEVPRLGKFLNVALVDIPVGVLKLCSLALPSTWVGLAKWVKHQSTRRKAVYKSANEILIAALLGRVQSGCMSNEDRGGLVDIFTKDLLLQYHHSGEFTGFNDDKTKLIDGYLKNTENAHNKAKMTVDSPVLKMMETHHPVFSSGLATEQETQEELALSILLKDNRKGEFQYITIEDFIRQARGGVVSGSSSSAKIASLTGVRYTAQGYDEPRVDTKNLRTLFPKVAIKQKPIKDAALVEKMSSRRRSLV